MLATSAEFCLPAAQDAQDCESIQFISGMARAATVEPNGTAGRRDQGRREASSIMLTFGVNDCEARVGRLRIERVWELLVPLPGANDTCQ